MLHEIRKARAAHDVTVEARVSPVVDVLDACCVGPQVFGCRIAEARLLFFLIARQHRHAHALAGHFDFRQRRHACEHALQACVDVTADELAAIRGAACVGTGLPCGDDPLQVPDQQSGRGFQVLTASGIDVGRGIALRDEIGERPLPCGVGRIVAILAPQQKLDRMPAARDVLFAAGFVLRGDQLGRDFRKALGIADDVETRRCVVAVELHGIDVVLIQWPAIDLRLGTVGPVDRSGVEAKCFGVAVRNACFTPTLPCFLERLLAGMRDQLVDCPVQGLGGSKRVFVGGQYQISVCRHDGSPRVVRWLAATAAGEHIYEQDDRRRCDARR